MIVKKSNCKKIDLVYNKNKFWRKEEYQLSQFKLNLTTIGAEDSFNKFTELFAHKDIFKLHLRNFDPEDEDQKNAMLNVAYKIVPNYKRDFIDLTDDGILYLTIRSEDPSNYQEMIRSNLNLSNINNSNLIKEHIKDIIYMLTNCYSFTINNDKIFDIIKNDLEKKDGIFVREVVLIDLNRKIKSTRKVFTQDTYENSYKKIWYISRVSSVTICTRVKREIKKMKRNYPKDIINLNWVRDSYIIEDLIHSYTNDIYIKVMELDDANKSIFSLPIVYQHKDMGIYGRNTTINLYHIMSKLVNSTRWALFSNTMVEISNNTLNVEKIKKDMSQVMKSFTHDLFSMRELNLDELPKIRTFDKDNSFIIKLSFGKAHYYSEVPLNNEQKEFLNDGGLKDELV